MEDCSPTVVASPIASPFSVRRWLLVLVVLAPGLFVAAACGSKLLIDRANASVGVQLSILILFATILSLFAAGAVVRHLVHWRNPTRMLVTRIEQIRDNTARIEELSTIGGAAAPVAKLVHDLFCEMKQQRAEVTRMESDLRQRVAQRTDALERELGTMRTQANKDPLTGLQNRRILNECLKTTLDRAVANLFDVTVLMADLDNFKLLNDTLGHPAGDEFLKAVGQIIRSTIRPNDFAFRCGGDEFVVVLAETGPEAATHFARRLVSLVDAIGKSLRLVPPVGMSIGMASRSELNRPNAEELLAAADKNLYQVKTARKAASIHPTPSPIKVEGRPRLARSLSAK